MNKLIICALLVACVLAGRPVQRKSFADTKTVLAELDQDHFGKTFISAIALNMAAANPQEDIILLIDEITAQLQKDQAQSDANNQTNQAVCDQNIGGFRNQIKEQTETISTLEKSITDNREILANAETSLEQANKDYDETVEAIQKGTAEREAQHAKWADEDYQAQIQVATLEEGVKLIQHMVHGVAFAQIKTRYDKVLEKLRNADSKRATLFKPLIASLAQLATKLNYENVMKILDLLNNIRKGIVEEQEAARTAEERAQADWQTLLNTLENQKQSLADKKARLSALIDATKTLLEQLTQSLENHKVELENVQASLAAQTAWCDSESSTQESQTSERTRELDILNKLREHLQEKFAAVNEYVASRAQEAF